MRPTHRPSTLVLGVLLTLAVSSTDAGYSMTDIVGAAKRGDFHAVHHILQTYPEAVASTDDAGFTALHWAGIRGHWRVFAELLEAGAPVNAVGGDGGTPLHWAGHHDNAAMIARLLDAGADPEIANRWGRTALHTAARRGCAATAALLVERGASVDAVTNEGWTPLHVAMMADHPEVATLLIAAGADPSATDNDGRIPAEVARTRPPEIGIEPARLDDYVGIYDLGGGFTAKVWREGDRLRIREFAPDGLSPTGADEFFCDAEPWRVEFGRGDDGAVDSIVLHFLRRSIRGDRAASPVYVGSAVCADCHSGPAGGSPQVTWMRSRHGHAYWRLGSDWSRFLGRLRPQYSDLESPIADDRCLLCHVTGRQDDDALLAEGFRPEEGVGCESCHGPGSLYVDPEVMADREAFVAAGGRVPDETTCRSCHRRSESFDWDEKWPKIAHGNAPLGLGVVEE